MPSWASVLKGQPPPASAKVLVEPRAKETQQWNDPSLDVAPQSPRAFIAPTMEMQMASLQRTLACMQEAMMRMQHEMGLSAPSHGMSPEERQWEYMDEEDGSSNSEDGEDDNKNERRREREELRKKQREEEKKHRAGKGAAKGAAIAHPLATAPKLTIKK